MEAQVSVLQAVCDFAAVIRREAGKSPEIDLPSTAFDAMVKDSQVDVTTDHLGTYAVIENTMVWRMEALPGRGKKT